MFVLLDATLEEAALVPSTRQGLFGVQTHPPPGKTGIAETFWAETKIWASLKWWVREDTVIGGVWVGVCLSPPCGVETTPGQIISAAVDSNASVQPVLGDSHGSSMRKKEGDGCRGTSKTGKEMKRGGKKPP